MAFFLYFEIRDGEEGHFLTYWYATDDLNIGIAAAHDHCQAIFPGIPVHLESVTQDDSGAYPDDFAFVSPGLYLDQTQYVWPLSPDDPDFIFPRGIVPADVDGPLEIEDITESYTRGTYTEGDYYLKLVVDQRQLKRVFQSLFTFLPSKDGLEIQLMSHWENTEINEVFLAPDEMQGHRILAFLNDHERDLIENGGVEIAVYSREEGCALRLTDHKLIGFFADEIESIDRFEAYVRSLGYHMRNPFRSVAEEYQHYHYQMAGSLNRRELRTVLHRARFTAVDTLVVEKV